MHLAELAGQENIPCHTRRRFVPVAEVDHALHACFVRCRRQGICFLCRHGDRFLHAIWFARRHRRHSDLVMGNVRCGNIDSVYRGTGDEVVVVREPMRLVDAVLFPTLPQSFRIRITNRREDKIWGRLNPGDVDTGGDVAKPYRTDTDFLHRVHAPSIRG